MLFMFPNMSNAMSKFWKANMILGLKCREYLLSNFLRLASQRLDRIKLRLHDNCLKAIEEHVKQNFVFVVSFRKED